MEKNPWLRALIILGVVFVAVQLFAVGWDVARRFSDIILVFFLAWLITFLLNPVVEFLTIGKTMPRIAAVAAVYLGLLAILVAIGLLIVPPTANQISGLGHKLPQYTANATGIIDSTQAWLDGHGIQMNVAQFTTERELAQEGQRFGSVLAGHALELAQSVVGAIFDGVVVLVISFYMMLDAPRIARALVNVTPRRFRDDTELLFASIDRSFGGYLRASFILALVYGAGTALAMYVLGVPFALPVSAFAGFMLIIPLVGDIVAVIPPIMIGLFTVSLVRVALLLAVMVILQQLVLQILRPRIMGRSVGLHPLWVLAAFLVGARAAGIWGALFSVPIAAIVQTIVQLYYYRVARIPDREGALSRSLRGNRTPEESPAVDSGPIADDAIQMPAGRLRPESGYPGPAEQGAVDQVTVVAGGPTRE